jgi:group I intron endonuclease
MRQVKLGLKFSEITRAKMRKSGLERLNRLGKLGHFQGKNHSEESKAKIGSYNLGRKHSTETIEKMIANSPLSLSVVVTNKETNEIKELTSKRQATKYLNTSLGTVINYEKSGKIFKGKYSIQSNMNKNRTV